jgi:hypothetical protein
MSQFSSLLSAEILTAAGGAHNWHHFVLDPGIWMFDHIRHGFRAAAETGNRLHPINQDITIGPRGDRDHDPRTSNVEQFSDYVLADRYPIYADLGDQANAVLLEQHRAWAMPRYDVSAGP